jgi:hypothetical protein
VLPARSQLLPVLVLSLTGVTALAFAGPDQPAPSPAPIAPGTSSEDPSSVPDDEGLSAAEAGLFASGFVTVTVGPDQRLPRELVGEAGPGDDAVGAVEVDSIMIERAAETRTLLSSADAVEAVSDEVADDPAEVGADAADEGAEDAASDDAPTFVAADGDEVTAERVEAFLAGRGAPLADHAATIVAAGIEHDVDPRLIVGIAIAESNGGKRLPAGSYNAWGWSGSGSHGLRHWSSWEASIDDFTERLGRIYDTSAVDESFARTYCPPNWRWWLETVTWTMGAI